MGFLDDLRVDINKNKKGANNSKDNDKDMNKPKKKTNADIMKEIEDRKLRNLPEPSLEVDEGR